MHVFRSFQFETREHLLYLSASRIFLGYNYAGKERARRIAVLGGPDFPPLLFLKKITPGSPFQGRLDYRHLKLRGSSLSFSPTITVLSFRFRREQRVATSNLAFLPFPTFSLFTDISSSRIRQWFPRLPRIAHSTTFRPPLRPLTMLSPTQHQMTPSRLFGPCRHYRYRSRRFHLP